MAQSEIDTLIEQIESRLGEGYGLTIQTRVVTADGERVTCRWKRSGAGFEGERLAVGYSIADVLRKADFIERQWEEAAAAKGAGEGRQ